MEKNHMNFFFLMLVIISTDTMLSYEISLQENHFNAVKLTKKMDRKWEKRKFCEIYLNDKKKKLTKGENIEKNTTENK